MLTYLESLGSQQSDEPIKTLSQAKVLFTKQQAQSYV